MIEDKVPMTIQDLQIKGNQIIENYPFIKVNTIKTLLEKLLYICVDRPMLNDKKLLIEQAGKIINKNKSFYLE